MSSGARVTDAVGFHARRGEMRGAVRVVRKRAPEKFRWRKAVMGVNKVAGSLRGLDRMHIEEPVREMVLDLSDFDLKREVVLDARRVGVDLDRGELLPRLTLADLRRLAFLTDCEVQRVGRYTKLPMDFGQPIDTAACVVVGRSLADHHRRRARRHRARRREHVVPRGQGCRTPDSALRQHLRPVAVAAQGFRLSVARRDARTSFRLAPRSRFRVRLDGPRSAR